MPLTSKGFPLFLTFDLDAETMWTGRDPAYANRPILMSQGAYGWKVGMGRVLDLLDRYGVKATFFVPGIVYLADAIGTQSEVVAVRALSLTDGRLVRLLASEFAIGFLVGRLLQRLPFH